MSTKKANNGRIGDLNPSKRNGGLKKCGHRTDALKWRKQHSSSLQEVCGSAPVCFGFDWYQNLKTEWPWDVGEAVKVPGLALSHKTRNHKTMR